MASPNAIETPGAPQTGSSPAEITSPKPLLNRTATSATVSSITGRLRSVSLRALNTDVPLGFSAATGSAIGKAPTFAELRNGSLSSGSLEGVNGSPRPMMGRSSTGFSAGRAGAFGPSSATTGTEPFPSLAEEPRQAENSNAPLEDKTTTTTEQVQQEAEVTVDEGPPPKVPWTTSTLLAIKAFLLWTVRPPGLNFFITLYGLNVVAWGGMLFLLLCNASPAMCSQNTPENHNDGCNDINSPRRIWIEVDSQILNALFCVTGFGLAPWRFRDLYWWFYWRVGRGKTKETGIRRLAGIHRNWFRLPGSDQLPIGAESTYDWETESPAIPIPVAKAPSSPLTGDRAPPTQSWRMDFVVWCNVWNTFFQCVLCGFMWGMNRHNRPSWSTGLFVALGCIAAAAGGIMMAVEGKKVKKVEGEPVKPVTIKSEQDVEVGRVPKDASKDGAVKERTPIMNGHGTGND